MKNANTPSAKVKFLYVLAQENGGEDLRAILPAKKDDAIKLIADVCKANNVGGTRTITHKDGTTTEQTIKFSADMFVRFLCKRQNDGARTLEKAAKAEKRAAEKAERDAKEAAEKIAKKTKEEGSEFVVCANILGAVIGYQKVGKDGNGYGKIYTPAEYAEMKKAA